MLIQKESFGCSVFFCFFYLLKSVKRYTHDILIDSTLVILNKKGKKISHIVLINLFIPCRLRHVFTRGFIRENINHDLIVYLRTVNGKKKKQKKKNKKKKKPFKNVYGKKRRRSESLTIWGWSL